MNKSKGLIRFSIMGMIALFVFCASYVINWFEPVITPFLFGYGIDYDNEQATEAAKNGKELAIEIQSHGTVLLKNENNSLPLKDNKKLNVFGWGGCDNGYIYMGGGSGHGAGYDQQSLYKGLTQAGFELNQALCNDYNALTQRRTRGYTLDYGQNHKLYEPSNFLTDARLDAAKSFSDNALIVITRYGQEGTDWPKCQYDKDGKIVNNGRTYAQLTEAEEDMIAKVSNKFGNVCVLLNSSNTIECGFLNNEKIDSALYMAYGGSYGSIGVGRVLSGEVTPSGRTADTFAYDLTTAPSYINGGNDCSSHFTGQAQSLYPNAYTDYAEDIYVGYRYYETADKEGMFDKVDNEYGKGYKGVVQYPFGFGLSYASFDWELLKTNYENNATISKADDVISYEVIVTNTSTEYTGADVVQVYQEAPYTKGGIEKSAIELEGFAKTSELKPGQSEKVEIKINVRDLASYDCYDRNNNGHMGYELEEGNYNLSFRTDVHTLKEMKTNTLSYKVPAGGHIYTTDARTGYQVQNVFTTYTNETSGAESYIYEPAASAAYSIDGKDSNQNIQYLSRANFSQMPVKSENRNGDSIIDSLRVHAPFVNSDDVMPETGSKKTSWKLSDMGGLDYDDPRWQELVSQMTVNELAIISARGGYTAVKVDSIGKPAGIVVDGPSGLNSGIMSPDGVRAITYPCQTMLACTWDWKDAYKMGTSIGKEADAIGVTQWYGPGLNTHRSPLGGRNFEYFSEDPVLAGKLCAKEIQGAKEQGLACYVKHFAANDQDTNRGGAFKFLTEQSFREIYLKPFEIAVKEGGCNALMTSVDRIGTTRAAGSYGLLTEVLRNEWGFKGSVVTDFYQKSNVHDADENIRAGNDMQLDPNGKIDYFDDLESATAIIALQKSAHNQLYTYVEGKYLQATAKGEDLGSLIVVKKDVTPTWLIGLYVFDALAVAGLAAWAVVVAKKMKGQPW